MTLTTRVRGILTAVRAGGVAPAAPASAEGAVEPSAPAILDSYASEPPSPQLAADIFAGEWSSSFPPSTGIRAGAAPLFEDARIAWMLERVPVQGRTVLELGPLEGAHSWMLEQAGADVVAIEGNSRAYLKCLITKELLGMTRTKFQYGDFVSYLQASPPPVDIVLASGVLYHMREPLDLLDRLAEVTDCLVLWTHYFDEERLERAGFGRQFSDPPTVVERGGRTYTYHPRHYLEALQWGGFCGGPAVTANWLERDDLLSHLRQLGFERIEIGFDEPDSQNGPSILLVASRHPLA